VLTYSPPADFEVVLGDHDKSASEVSEQVRNVVQVVVHPDWDSATNDNDIALLKLDIPATLNSRVGIVPLGVSPTDDSLMQPGDLATVTGWGDTSEGGSTSAILQEVQLPIVSNLTCDAVMTASITDNMLCAGFVEGGKDSCQGDSGGPLVVPDGSGGWKLAGVVSFGSGCAQPGKYGVYARVSRYTSWIQSYINSPTGPTPIRNANFDLGQNGDWVEISSNAFPLIEDEGLPVAPRSNSHVAWLGGANNELSIIRQSVSLDEKATALTLYYQIRSTEAACPSNDIGAVRINGVIQPSSVTLCPASITSDWTPAFFDITSFAGRTILLDVRVSTDATDSSSMFVDDMSVTLAPVPALEITNFNPASSRTGTLVAVNGSNFLDVTEVLFNGAAASFSVQSDSVLNVTVPAQASTGIVTVKTAYSTTNSAQAFTVLQPLTVAKVGSGNGTITSAPDGVNCGDDCSEDYSDSTSVTLSAQPAANSLFSGWSGACSGNATECVINVNEAKSATATFTLKAFALNVGKVGAGSGSVSSLPAGITCGGDCSETYTIDADVTLTATPETDSIFAGWSGACTGDETDCTVNMNAAKAVSATFDLKSFSISVDKVGNGTITSNPAGITCGEDCSETYTIDTDIALTAVPGADSIFVGWSGACSGDDTDCTVHVDSAKAVMATFMPKTFILSVTKVGSGSVSSMPGGIDCGEDCTEPYQIATNVTLTAEPADDSGFVGWSGDCSGNNSTCSVTMDAAAEVTASFALKSFVLTVTKSGNGSGTIVSSPDGILCGEDCSESYAVGTSVTLSAQPDADSLFSRWNGACTGEQTTCTFTISESTEAGAVFNRGNSRVLLPLITP
jgi:hypothetical protein